MPQDSVIYNVELLNQVNRPTGAQVQLFTSNQAPGSATTLVLYALRSDGTYGVVGGGSTLPPGILNDRGDYDASGNVFPITDGSGVGGAIQRGDLWRISAPGILGGVQVYAGAWLRALTDLPGQMNSNWSTAEQNIGYIPENVANKATNFSVLNNTLYPTTLAVKTLVDSTLVNLLSLQGGYDPTITSLYPVTGGSGPGGDILKGNVFIISTDGTINGIEVMAGDTLLALTDLPGQVDANWDILQTNIGYVPENVANKATDFSILNNTLYPSTLAVASASLAFTNKTYNGLSITPTTGGVLTIVNGKTLQVNDTTIFNTNSIGFAGGEILTLAGTKNVTFADAFATSGAFSLVLTTTAATNITLPTAGTLATLAGTETLSNKTIGISNAVTLLDNLFTLQDNGDNTKQLQFQLSGITTGNTRILTIPDASGTIALTSDISGFVPNTRTIDIEGTANRITSSAAAQDLSANRTWTIDIANTYAGQNSIVTVGTLTGGATGAGFTIALGASTVTGVVSAVNGGTGIANNAANTLTFSGNFGLTLTLTNTTSVTLPTVGTLATLAGAEAFSNKTIGITNTVTLLDTLFTLQDNADTTKQLKFELSGISTGTTRTLTIPNANGTIALTSDISGFVPNTRTIDIEGTANRITSSAAAQDLSANRTWTIDIANTYAGQNSIVTVGTLTGGATGAGFTIALGASTVTGVVSAVNGGTGIANNAANTLTFSGNFGLTLTLTNTTSVTLPTAGTLATLAGAEAFSNKTIGITNTVTLLDTLFTLQDNADNTKQLKFELSGISTGTTRTLTIPNASGTIALTSDITNNITIGTTTIASGTTTRILYDNAGTVGEYTITGTGTVVAMQTTPTFVTNITTPLIIGGTGVTDAINYKGTTGNGTTTAAAHIWLVGNNGATEAMRIINSAEILVGTTTQIPAAIISVIRNQNSATNIQMRNNNASGAAIAQMAIDNGTDTCAFGMPGTGYSTTGAFVAKGGFLFADGTGGLSIAASNASGTLNWYSGGSAAGNLRINTNATGKTFFGGATSATALVQIAPGTTSIPPLKFTSGPLTTGGNILAGNVEFLTDDYYATITTGTARKTFVLTDGTNLTSGKIPVATTNGRLIDGPAYSSSTGLSTRISPRVVTMADATSFTPTGDTADINTQTNTQALGVLTGNAPSGTPVNGQQLELLFKSTNVQTFTWNAIYVGCTTTALPTATTGAGKTDRFFFQYNTTSSKWELINAQYGYA